MEDRSHVGLADPCISFALKPFPDAAHCQLIMPRRLSPEGIWLKTRIAPKYEQIFDI
ncbi:hypothetical protein [Novosphingobium guangzhouense]|uniref:hypothetical protein n=1 Tax=Novosphingobium guangzhouense TaxID=1850347 RepID=UPI001472E4C1|nr:hypothetical protein [Novosphingobium guangzhouense]